MSPPHPLPLKKDVALALLERSSVHVHLDPRQDGVVVPDFYKKQAQLVLQLGPVRIPDLKLDEDGMSCTLSFKGEPFFCVVPWASVFAMIGEGGVQGMVWPDDVPAEVARSTRANEGNGHKDSQTVAAREPKGEGTKAKRPRKRPMLAAVAEAGGEEPGSKPIKAVRSTPERSARPSAGVAQRPAVAPTPSPRLGSGGLRKKRKELPPYLRVVK